MFEMEKVQLINDVDDNESVHLLTFLYDEINQGVLFTTQWARGQYARFWAPYFISFYLSDKKSKTSCM